MQKGSIRTKNEPAEGYVCVATDNALPARRASPHRQKQVFFGNSEERSSLMTAAAAHPFPHRHRYRGTFTDIVSVDVASPAPCTSPRCRARPPIPPSGWCAGSMISSAPPAAAGDVAGLAHGTHGGHQRVAPGRDRSGSGSSSPRASGTSSKSPGSRCPKATAIRISG